MSITWQADIYICEAQTYKNVGNKSLNRTIKQHKSKMKQIHLGATLIKWANCIENMLFVCMAA